MAKITYDGRPEDYDYLIESGYDFDLGRYINRGWEIFTQYPGGYIGHMALSGLIICLTFWIPIINIGVILSMIAGSYIVSHKIAKKEAYTFSDFFSGFDHFGQLTKTGLLVFLCVLGGYIAFVIPGIYLAVGYGMVLPLVVLGRLKAWSAMEVSRKIISKNWWYFLLYGLIVGFLVSLGSVGFGIGMLITAPLQYTMMYAVYEDVLAHDLEEELMEEIGDDDAQGDE